MKLTRADIKKIQEEIDYRNSELRPKLLEDLRTARAQGDLSENFEYVMAKRANNKNLSRIRYLENMIRTAQVVEENAPEDVAGLNREVRVRFPEDDSEEVYKLVSSIRGDSMKNRISVESPLGKALKGHKAGDVVNVRVNDQYSYLCEILEVSAVIDDGSDELRSY
ncbi:MAG: GreA/GreB family elongation factor [Lachnospiraceae bacterium]|nr:GreA/GreB family elongation factor [Lachnospiraceae bacterium]